MDNPDLNSIMTQSGRSLGLLADEAPVLLIFLRHYG